MANIKYSDDSVTTDSTENLTEPLPDNVDVPVEEQPTTQLNPVPPQQEQLSTTDNDFNAALDDINTRLEEEESLLEPGETLYQPTPLYSYPTDIREWIDPYPIQDYDLHIDHSYSALAYLNSLGYKDCIWNFSETHQKRDICDDLQGRMFSISDVLANSYHVPPSPIFSLSHPGCNCFLLCINPTSPDEIPNTAPGLPIYGDEEEIRKYKQRIFPNLLPIGVDRVTFPPTSTHYSYVKQPARYASEWKLSIQPVATNTLFRAFLPLGFFRIFEPEMKGFLLERSSKFAKVYFYQLQRLFIVPLCALQVLSLVKTSEKKPGVFITTSDTKEKTVGIILEIRENSVLAYLPEYRSAVTIKNFSTFL